MTAADILKNYDLSKTHCRVLVLEHLIKSPKALSQTEIEESLRPLCNRSTIYRILNKLSNRKIIQQIMIDEVNKYFFDDKTIKNASKYVYIYFLCISCNLVIPVDKLTKDRFNLAEGFVKLHYNFVIKGTCNKCNKKQYNNE